MKKFILDVNNTLTKKTLLRPNDKCLCAISGGQDSILLFIILLHLKKQWNIDIRIVHFHHFWQEKNYFTTQQVWKLAFLFNTPISIVYSELVLENEKKAREWRQKGLERLADIENLQKVLTGHTATDRFETAFWHLIRGTSQKGLLSIKPQNILLKKKNFSSVPHYIPIQFLQKKKIKTKISKKQLKEGFKILPLNRQKLKKNYHSLKNENPIIKQLTQQKKRTFLFVNLVFSKKYILRPLVNLYRNDITSFSKNNKLPIIIDPTNKVVYWSRNRIRHQIIPILKFFFNPNVEYVITNFLEISFEEQNYIEYLVKQNLTYLIKQNPDSSLIKKQVQNLPNAIQKRLLEKIFHSYNQIQLNFLNIDFLHFKIKKII